MENNPKFQEIKADMTRKATDLLAASIIASPKFPQEEALPDFLPSPFQHHGHAYLFDKVRYFKIIYQSIIELKEYILSKKIKSYWEYFLFVLLFVICTFYLSFGINAIGFILLFAFFSSIGIWFYHETVMSNKNNKAMLEYKIGAIKKILNNQWSERENAVYSWYFDDMLKTIAKLDYGQEIPIIVAFSELVPFPSYGLLQSQKTFFCMPDEKANASIDENVFFDNLTEKLKIKLELSQINNIHFSNVIIINAESIDIDSYWLDTKKMPKMFLPIEDLANIYNFDKNISLRRHFVIEMLFPEYESSVCFFIRVFKSINSIGCHISITTLGPPRDNQKKFEDVLMGIEITEQRKAYIKSLPLFPLFVKIKNEESTKFDKIINKFYNNLYINGEYIHEKITLKQIVNIEDIVKNNVDLTQDNRGIKIIESSKRWNGKWEYDLMNVREEYSLTLGGDFFGKPELIGGIKNVYEKISKIVLENFEEMGYDISEYKDNDGKISINADNIDNLIVGEKINYNANAKKNDTKEKNNTDSINKTS